MILDLDPNSLESYALFLRVKALPRFRIVGRTAEVPDEYAHLLGLPAPRRPDAAYVPLPALFDYQRDISQLAIRKRKFAVFMEPGYGKTLIDFEFARHAHAVTGGRVLLVAPPMVIPQMLAEYARFYTDGPTPERVYAPGLQAWLSARGAAFGLTNYQAIREGLTPGNLSCLILSESSMLKSMYGKWGQRLIDLGRGLEWKLCETGTPAPNDRIEYGNHAVFLDQFPTLNSFLSRYFVNRGQTQERWELKAHALRPFYTSLAHWCIFVNNPATYGWRDNTDNIPPIHVHIHDVPLTDEQAALVHRAGGDMYGTPGGITSRAKLSQLAKGRHEGRDVPSHKPGFIRDLAAGWRGRESTLVWCVYNAEQESMERMFPGAASILGATPEGERLTLLEDFRAGRRDVCISKAEVLGFGLNLQVATRQIFSGLVDSYEDYWQCVKRSNRVGSTLPLNVHLPVTAVEYPMIETVLRKARRVGQDTEEQERIFKENRCVA